MSRLDLIIVNMDRYCRIRIHLKRPHLASDAAAAAATPTSTCLRAASTHSLVAHRLGSYQVTQALLLHHILSHSSSVLQTMIYCQWLFSWTQ